MTDSFEQANGSLLELRRKLVHNLRRSGNLDDRVLQAILEVPREAFIDPEYQKLAYEDSALPIASGQTISQPTVVAKMTSELDVTPDSHVLEIGTGSGYQAAILSRLARSVVSIERHAALAERSRRVIDGLGIENVEIHVADGSKGWPEGAPYDRIIVTAASPTVPAALMSQLRQAEGSCILVPVGDQELQSLVRLQYRGGNWEREAVAQVRFVPLRGEAGWTELEWRDQSRRRHE